MVDLTWFGTDFETGDADPWLPLSLLDPILGPNRYNLFTRLSVGDYYHSLETIQQTLIPRKLRNFLKLTTPIVGSLWIVLLDS